MLTFRRLAFSNHDPSVLGEVLRKAGAEVTLNLLNFSALHENMGYSDDNDLQSPTSVRTREICGGKQRTDLGRSRPARTRKESWKQSHRLFAAPPNAVWGKCESRWRELMQFGA